MIEHLDLDKKPKVTNPIIHWLSRKRNQAIALAVAALLILIALVLILSNQNANNNNDTQDLGNPVLESYRQKIPELEDRLRENENDTQARRELAVALYATGDMEGSKEHYLKELESNPNDPVLYNNLGNVYRDTGEYQKAVEAYQKSIDIDGSQSNAYLNLSNLYIYTLGEPDLGLGVLRQAIEKSSSNAEVMYLQIGNTYVNLGNTEDARSAYNSVLEINPSNVAAQNALNNL